LNFATTADADDSIISAVRADLHELSQPLTVLLCTLEFSADLRTVAEMRSIVTAALLECERMKRIVSALRDKLPLETSISGDFRSFAEE
jgi:signal transduction histidine kinase